MFIGSFSNLIFFIIILTDEKSQDVLNNSKTSNEAFVESREYTGDCFFFDLSKNNPDSLSVIVVDRLIEPLEFNTTSIPGLSIATSSGNKQGVFGLWTPLTNVDDEGKPLPKPKALFRFPKQKSMFIKNIKRGFDVGKMFGVMIDMNDPLMDDDGNPGGMYWCRGKGE